MSKLTDDERKQLVHALGNVVVNMLRHRRGLPPVDILSKEYLNEIMSYPGPTDLLFPMLPRRAPDNGEDLMRKAREFLARGS